MHYVSSSAALSGLGFSPVSAQIPILRPRTSDVQKLVNGALKAYESMIDLGWSIKKGHLGDKKGMNFYLPCFLLKLQAAAGLTRSGMADRETMELISALDDIAGKQIRAVGTHDLAKWIYDRFGFRVALPGGGTRAARFTPSAAMRVQASQLNQAVGRKGSAYYNWITDVGPTSALAKQPIDKLEGQIKIIDLFDAAIYNRSSAYQQGWYTNPDSGLKPWSVMLALAVQDMLKLYQQVPRLKVTVDVQKWLWGHLNTTILPGYIKSRIAPAIKGMFQLPTRITKSMVGRDPGFAEFWGLAEGQMGYQMVRGWNPNTWPGALYERDRIPWTQRAGGPGGEEFKRQQREEAAAAELRRQEERVKEADRKKAEADRQGRQEREADRKERLEYYTAAYKAEAEVLRLRGQALTRKMTSMVPSLTFSVGGGGGAAGGGGNFNVAAGGGGGVDLNALFPAGAGGPAEEPVEPAADLNTPNADGEVPAAPPAPPVETLPVDGGAPAAEEPKKGKGGVILLAAGAAAALYFALQG